MAIDYFIGICKVLGLVEIEILRISTPSLRILPFLLWCKHMDCKKISQNEFLNVNLFLWCPVWSLRAAMLLRCPFPDHQIASMRFGEQATTIATWLGWYYLQNLQFQGSDNAFESCSKALCFFLDCGWTTYMTVGYLVCCCLISYENF